MQYAIERQLTLAIENQPGRLAATARVMAAIRSWAVIERAHAEGLLEIHTPPVPMLVFDRQRHLIPAIRQLFIERIEEGTLYGRFPDLWPAAIPALDGRPRSSCRRESRRSAS